MFADCLLYESKEYANEGVEEYRESCESYGGGGGEFSYSVSESPSNNTCDGAFAENAFVLRVSCNTCNSLEMKEELEENKKYCNKICKTAMMTCMTTLNSWGSTLNGSRESCGLNDHTLPGCEESSSSSELKSSSSQVCSSSSSFKTKSSSSKASSSSIANNLFGYTEGLHLCPTEATSYFNLDGNYCKETGFCKCYNSNTTRIKFFTKRPNYYGQLEYSLLCFVRQSNPTIMIKTNLPYVTVTNNAIAYCFNDIETCKQNWNSNYVTYVKIPTIYNCRANSLNYTVSVDPAKGCSVTKNTDNDSYGMVFWGLGVTEASTLSDLSWLAGANADQLPANFNFYDLLNRSEIVSSFERCVSELKYYNSIKSSSSQFSSSSEESSSSSKLESYSSSLEEDTSSSEESSSSEELSSSSEYGLCKSLPFGYIPNDPKNTCFESNGKCYRCNVARRADECDKDWMWIYPYTPDKYFFTEIDCESGERRDDNRIGQCPGFPMENLPNYPERACIAYNGKCYRCKSENNNVDCSYDWLWTGDSFGTYNIGWWYEEVDCYNPFENENFDGQCPDEFIFKKSAMSETENNYESTNYTNGFSPIPKTFDVLGRRLNGIKRLHQITFTTNKTKNTSSLNSTFDIGSVINIPIENLGISRNILAKAGATCPIYTYGELGKDYGVGNDIGVYCGYPCTKLNVENGFTRVEITNKEQIGFCGENNPKYTITFKISATTTIMRGNEYYVAPVGYKLGDNYVTEEDYNAGERHEKGHKESYLCLEKNNMFKTQYVFEMENICEKDFKCDKNNVLKGFASIIRSALEEQKETGTNKLVDYNNNLWQKMCGWYHSEYSHNDGPGGPGYAATLTCPTKETLLNKNYDLTGCEVVK